MVARTQQQSKAASLPRQRKFGFTLVELLMVIMIIGVLSTFVLVALAGVNQTAKEDRTKAQIKRIHELVFEKWEQYRYRRVPPTSYMAESRQTAHTANNRRTARERLKALRELMRMEMPTFMADVVTPARFMRDSLSPNYKQPYRSSLQLAYQQRSGLDDGDSTWSASYQTAECLYLILSQIRDADSSALEFFKENEIGDVDGDGMNEILDAWGTPIEWLLWAPGYVSPMQVPLAQDTAQDDAFDPSTYGSGHAPSSFAGTFSGDGFNLDFSMYPRTLYPLIYSAGADGKHGIVIRTVDENDEELGWAAVNNDPYSRKENSRMFLLGATSAKNPEALADDISNHYLTTR